MAVAAAAPAGQPPEHGRRTPLHLSRLRGRSPCSIERGGWGLPAKQRALPVGHPHPSPPPQAGEGAQRHCRGIEPSSLGVRCKLPIRFSNSAFRRGSAPRGALRPSFARDIRPKKGVGNAGCPMHPQPRARIGSEECARVFTASSPDQPGIPARERFDGLWRTLPGDEFVLPPSPANMFCLRPVGPTKTPPT